MPAKKRKKNIRMRGSMTHGWGAKKKHRGAGNRGGRGMAGSGKRADQKKPTILKLYGTAYYGKKGFRFHGKKIKQNGINISYLDENLDRLIEKKLVLKENDFYVVDLDKIGYNKLLAGGNTNKKFKIITLLSSKNAIEKIKNAGGEVILKK